MTNVKNISIKSYLANRGIHPKRETAHDGYYLSPLRSETTPSFHVNYLKNLWHDFGANKGGSIIDLVMQLDHCSVAEAFAKLKNVDTVLPYNRPEQEYKRPESSIKVVEIRPLSHPKLIDYITKERGINLDIAKHYCREVHYSMGSSRMFSVGFQSDAGGWELSGPRRFKLSTSPKAPTSIKNDSDACMVFEGFMDMLSYLTLKNTTTPSVNMVVLNSVANLKKAKVFLCKHRTLHCCMDNDAAGRKALSEIQSWGIQTVDHAHLYKDFNDLNDYLKSKNQVQKTSQRGMRI